MKIIQDFKAFAMKGSVIDLAVAVIIGAAFGKIVSSLVNNILMPPIGLLIGGVNFSDLKIPIKQAVHNSSGAVVTPEVAINYGDFLQATFDFLIVAVAIFLFIRLITNISIKKLVPVGEKTATPLDDKTSDTAPTAAPAPTTEVATEVATPCQSQNSPEVVALLTQIRDLLQSNKTASQQTSDKK